jgi:hypothetical protein
MEYIAADQLPTTTIGLISLMLVLFTGTLVWLTKHFVKHSERISTKFAETVETLTRQHADERREMEARLRECYIAK